MEKIKLINYWKTVLLLIGMSLFAGNIYAQGTINGRVVDQTGEPLIGATVKITGQNDGVTTDISGNFAIRGTTNITSLTISYIGYVTLNVPVRSGSTNLGNIVLASDANNLSEVVVVGYGTLKKQDVTGTVVTVDAKVLQEIPATNVFEQLKGRVAGLDVVTGANGLPSITIRGNRTIGNPGADQPLIVLDGVPFRNSIENINPNDIKSVDVLKGASATAIYGSRGSGGVLLITTNRGRVGQAQVSLDSYYGINTLQGELNVLDAAGYIQLKKDVLRGSIMQNSSVTDPNSLTPAEQAGIANGTNTNWAKLLIKNGFITDHSLRISGGNEKTQYTVGMGYNQVKGLQARNNTQRITLNTAIDHRVSKLLKFGVSIQNSLRLIEASGGDNYGTAQWFSPLISPYNADGSINPTPLVGSQDQATANPLLQGSLPDAYYNSTRGFVNNDIVYAEFSPIEHFKYRYQVGYSYSQSLQGQYNGINGAGIVAINRTSASTNNNSFYALTQEHLLTYDNKFGKHNINFVAGYTQETTHTENSGVNVLGIPQDANRNSNLGLGTFNAFQNNAWNETGLISYLTRLNYAFANKYDVTATFRVDGNSVLAQGKQFTSYPSIGLGWVISNEDFMRQFAFVDNLKLRAGYGETSTISGNPYQTLGQLSQNNYQYGGSAAGNAQGVRVSNLVNSQLTWQRTADFNLALDFSILKGRISGSIEGYAQKTTGIILNNILPVTTGAANQNSNLGNSSNRGIEVTLSTINVRGRNGLSWTTDFNIGFARERIDLLPNGAPFNIGSGLWVGQPLSVIYDLRKIGIWQISDSPGLDAARTATAGQPVYQPIAGISPAQYPGQIRVEDVDKNGVINNLDNQILGHSNPNYTFGFTNRVSYRNFDLSVVIQGRMGFTTVVPYISSSNSNAQGWQFLNIGRHNQPVIPYWTPENPGGTFPMPNTAQGNYYSTLQYYDGSFIRAKSINLGYNVPSTVLKKVGISSLRVYANVTNPFFIYAPVRNNGFSVPDAESTAGVTPNAFSASGNVGGNGGQGGQSRSVGLNAGQQIQSFVFGINARF
jgi:TonB-linked SusC/RagA family outer membrane protein